MCDITQVGSVGSSPSYQKSNSGCGLCVVSAVWVHLLCHSAQIYSETSPFLNLSGVIVGHELCCQLNTQFSMVLKTEVQRNVFLTSCVFPFNECICPLAKLLHC